MARFVKSALKVGQYESPDETLEITRERLRHWEQAFLGVRDAGYQVPVDWDHAENLQDAKPVDEQEFIERKRSAKNIIGNLHDFRVAPDGNSAEITVDVSDAKAIEAADSNRISISPVIFGSWRDGAGRVHKDVITHVDFVDYPVDYSQTPFKRVNDCPVVACSLRIGKNPTALSLSMADENDEKKPAENGDAAPADSGAPADAAPAAEPVKTDPHVSAVVSALADMGINLPETNTPEDLLMSLYGALVVGGPNDPNADVQGNPGGQQMAAMDPGYAAMSLRLKESTAYATKMHRQSIQGRLKSLLESGRCTPDEMAKQKEAVEAVRLSLNKEGEPIKGDVEKWIESRESLPANACFSTVQRTRMATTVVEPKTKTDKADVFTEADADRVVKEMFAPRA